MSYRSIKYRLYPTKQQAILFEQTFGCCRKLWNLMLSDKINYYQNNKTNYKTFVSDYKKRYAYFKDIDSLALANVKLNLDQAYNNFLSKRSKFPKFKSRKHSKKSYTTNYVSNNIRFDNNYIRLPKIGFVKTKLHRLPLSDWKIKSVTVSQNHDGKYYASVLFEFKSACEYVINKSNAIGFDYSSSNLYVDSNGNIGTNHKFYKESHKKLAKAQRRLSRKQGSKKNEIKSNNYIKQLLRVNRIHQHIANQRLDNLHKLSTEIANHYDIVCVESLNLRAMSNKGFGNGRSTLDNGYGMFLSLLDYKLSERNKILIKVDKWFPSSQICHKCNYRDKRLKDLSIREWECPVCHEMHDRDINAAINILQEGLRLFENAA